MFHLFMQTYKHFGWISKEWINYFSYFRDYLQAESLDKKKQPFDMSDWKFEIAKVIRSYKISKIVKIV